MSLWLSLPPELQAAVMTPWLELTDVLSLDSAACNHSERAQWLDVIYSPVYDFACRQSDPECQPTFFERVGHDVKIVTSYMRWIQKHSIRVKSFCVVGPLQAAMNSLPDHGKRLTKMEFIESFKGDRSSRSKLVDLQKLCPNVTNFAFSHGVGPSNLKSVVSLWPLLQEITLFKENLSKVMVLIAQQCNNLKSITATERSHITMSQRSWRNFFKVVSVNLQHVRCYSNIGNKALLIMAQRCTQLRTLQGDFPEISSKVLASIATGSPLIETFAMVPMVEPHEGLVALARNGCLRDLTATSAPAEALQHVPGLKRLKLNLVPSYQARTIIGAVTAHCPALIEFAFLSSVDYDTGFDQPFSALVQSCPLLEILKVKLKVGTATLTALGAHCHDLRTLHLQCLADGVTDAALTALAQGCPKLRHLTLRRSQEDAYFAAGITALSAHCPHLRKVFLDSPLYDEEVMDVTRVGNLQVVDETAPKPVPFYQAFASY
jgi:hypothetical protein